MNSEKGWQTSCERPSLKLEFADKTNFLKYPFILSWPRFLPLFIRTHFSSPLYYFPVLLFLNSVVKMVYWLFIFHLLLFNFLICSISTRFKYSQTTSLLPIITCYIVIFINLFPLPLTAQFTLHSLFINLSFFFSYNR